jgi:hypothetical protein
MDFYPAYAIATGLGSGPASFGFFSGEAFFIGLWP